MYMPWAFDMEHLANRNQASMMEPEARTDGAFPSRVVRKRAPRILKEVDQALDFAGVHPLQLFGFWWC